MMRGQKIDDSNRENRKSAIDQLPSAFISIRDFGVLVVIAACNILYRPCTGHQSTVYVSIHNLSYNVPKVPIHLSIWLEPYESSTVEGAPLPMGSEVPSHTALECHCGGGCLNFEGEKERTEKSILISLPA